mmetsp:Transcript_23391/g.66190  ORF Transcript_23391/g.66190 Transcript_23391/m.66190 type:complete len:336 (+) Transcript_23391:88-1095(+)
MSLGWWRCLQVVAVPLFLHFWAAGPQLFDGFSPESLKGRRVLVCGASTGIGEQLVYQYARFGAHVAAIARSETDLRRVTSAAAKLGAASATPVVADVSSPEAARNEVEQVLRLKDFEGGLDVLVLNHVVGFWGWMLPENLTAESASTPPAALARGEVELGSTSSVLGGGFDKIQKLFEVNALSYMYLSTVAAPALARSGSAAPGPGGGGQLIVVSSAAGKLGLPKVAPYSSTKHALHGFFDSLRLEFLAKQLPVSVTLCVLGNIDTEANKRSTGDDLKHAPKHAPADETALAIVRGGATRQREIYYPLSQGLHYMALLRPFFPTVLDKIALSMIA